MPLTPLSFRFAGAALATACCAATGSWAQNISLGTAANFGVLAGSAVTNTGPTVVTGNVGVWPGTAITGFPPGSIAPGSGFLHSATPAAQQAQSDLTAAYTDAATRVCATPIAGGLLGGLVLTPGVYCMPAGALTGTLTLDGAGVYIFQMASTLTTAAASSVLLQNGAVACGVWWQVGSSATIGTTSAMAGNVLALTSITMNTGASLGGRTLARNGAVTLDSNAVTACSGGPGPAVPAAVALFPPTTPVPMLSTGVMILLAGLMLLGAYRAAARAGIRS